MVMNKDVIKCMFPIVKCGEVGTWLLITLIEDILLFSFFDVCRVILIEVVALPLMRTCRQRSQLRVAILLHLVTPGLVHNR